MDDTGWLTFRRPRVTEFFSLIILAPLGAASLIGSPLVLIDAIKTQPPLLVVAMTVFGVLPAMMFGFAMVAITLFSVRKVRVSRQQIRLSSWLKRSRTIDLSSLTHIVLCGDSPRLVFLPHFGPPLVTLKPGDFPRAMPDAISEHVGVRIERLESADKAALQAKYPSNAKEINQGRGFDDEWRGRQWQW